MASLKDADLRTVSLLGAIAALVAAGAGAYMLLIAGQGVGPHLGRIFIFVPGFVALLVIACAAGALTRGLTQRAALLGMAAAGLGALGYLWIWIHLLRLEIGFLLLIAGGLATLAMASAILRGRRRLSASLSAVIGVCLTLLLLGAGLSITTAPACGPDGRYFHIDTWNPPGAIYVCADGRLSVERLP